MRTLTNFSIALAAIFFLHAATAAAVEVTANVQGVYTDDTFTTLDPSFDGSDPQSATADLAAGQGIIVTIDIANPTAQNVDAIFTTLNVDNSLITFIGGAADPDVLLGGPIFAPTSLTRVAQPGIKGNSPSLGGSTETWVQSTAYAAQGGTDGEGPNLAAVQLFFVVAGASGNGQVDLFLELTEGDALNSATDGDISGTSTLTSAAINAPEPGVLALGVAALGTIGLVTRRRRA
jgi:hypothetical protein